ncbi:UNVERIFIED_ORG: hypothetical protein EC838_0340 [Providencia alcalifaciens]
MSTSPKKILQCLFIFDAIAACVFIFAPISTQNPKWALISIVIIAFTQLLILYIYYPDFVEKITELLTSVSVCITSAYTCFVFYETGDIFDINSFLSRINPSLYFITLVLITSSTFASAMSKYNQFRNS